MMAEKKEEKKEVKCVATGKIENGQTIVNVAPGALDGKKK